MKNRFDCLGINFNVFRLYYDYVIHNVRAVYPMMSMFISEQGIADIETLQSLGLFDLDPEGVTFLGGKFTGSFATCVIFDITNSFMNIKKYLSSIIYISNSFRNIIYVTNITDSFRNTGHSKSFSNN